MLNNLRFKVEDFLLRKLHANIIIIQEFWVHDKDGKALKHYKKHAHSLVGNFLQYLYTQFSRSNTTDFASSSFNGVAGNMPTKGTDGNVSTCLTYKYYASMAAAVGVTTNGIQFGIGITAPTALDYKIENLIANGTTAGCFSYQQQGAIQAPIAVGNVTTFILQRIAVNSSPGAITVNEIAIVGAMWSGDSSLGTYFCLYRDAVSPGIQVLATQTLTAQVTFQVVT